MCFWSFFLLLLFFLLVCVCVWFYYIFFLGICVCVVGLYVIPGRWGGGLFSLLPCRLRHYGFLVQLPDLFSFVSHSVTLCNILITSHSITAVTVMTVCYLYMWLSNRLIEMQHYCKKTEEKKALCFGGLPLFIHDSFIISGAPCVAMPLTMRGRWNVMWLVITQIQQRTSHWSLLEMSLWGLGLVVVMAVTTMWRQRLKKGLKVMDSGQNLGN